MSIKIFDCFSFFNENLILELRIKTLWDVVDFFVVSEANRDHSGAEKPSYFDELRFDKYKSKLRRVTLDAQAENLSGWTLENRQRDHVAHGLYDAEPSDLILVSDCDEIPNPSAVRDYEPKYLRGDFNQRYFSYAFNNELVLPSGKTEWFGTKITTATHFNQFFNRSATSVRSYKSNGSLRGIKRTLFRHFKTQKIENGGWHFTWIYDIKGICSKVAASAHSEYRSTGQIDPSEIERLIKNGYDLQIPSRRYRIAEIDESFPRDLVENRQHYARFFLRSL